MARRSAREARPHCPMKPQVFKTRRDIERYFSGDTIECLICGRHFKRLNRHLAAKQTCRQITKEQIDAEGMQLRPLPWAGDPASPSRRARSKRDAELRDGKSDSDEKRAAVAGGSKCETRRCQSPEDGWTPH